MHFYATNSDLFSPLAKIEARGAFKYVRFGSYSEPAFEIYCSALDIPNLGTATSESAITCQSFVVVSGDAKVLPREITQRNGVVRYVIDQLVNPYSFTFHPGGLHSSGALLYGRIATASTAPESRRLVGRFERALKKEFSKIAAFYVGPEASDLLDRGTRLTMALQSPPAYDLKRPNRVPVTD